MVKRALLTNIARIVTMVPGPGRDGPLGVIEDACVRIAGDRIAWVGSAADLPREEGPEECIDCAGALVLPGLIDCHTHLVFAGSRQHEFKLRSEGASYQEIAAAGGGILSTVRATRAATEGELLLSATRRADRMLSLGTTTIEIKTGYGLDVESERKMAAVIQDLAERHPATIVGTFLGAHVLPAEYRGKRDDYLRLVIETMLPKVAVVPAITGCDVFVEEGAYTPDEAVAIANAAKGHNLALHLHVDQFTAGGGAALAARMGAINASHLDHTDVEGMRAMAEAGVVPVLLPGASFFTGGGRYPDARAMCDAGLPVAISTDFNPGTNPSLDLMLNASIAVTQMKMTCDEALQGVTRHAARALRLDDRGTVEAGKRADLVLFGAPDEYALLYHYGTSSVQAVIVGGEQVTGKGLPG